MHVVLITPGFNADENDDCIPCLRDFARVLGMRHQVTILALRYPARNDRYRIDGNTVYSFGGSSRAHRWISAYMTLRRIEQEAPIDAVHLFFAGRYGVPGIAYAHLLHKSTVVTVMGGELIADHALAYGGARDLVGRIANRYVLGNAGLIVALSRHASAQIPAARLSKTEVVPFGVDPAKFSPEGPGEALEGAVKMLCVGSLEPVKGHALLFEALSAIDAAQDWVLHVVGEGSLREALAREAALRGIGARIRFHGQVAHSRLPDLCRGADALVVPSHYESQSMVAVEAAMCGCPVIGFDVGVLPELVAPEWLAPRGDVVTLGEVIQRMMADPGSARAEAAAWRDDIRREFSVVSRVSAMERCYEALLEERGSDAPHPG